MSNEELLHYATPLMRTPNLIHQRSILDHPPLYPWDSDVTMDFGRVEGASLISVDDALKAEEKKRHGDDMKAASWRKILNEFSPQLMKKNKK